jgi:hypothetical protein
MDATTKTSQTASSVFGLKMVSTPAPLIPTNSSQSPAMLAANSSLNSMAAKKPELSLQFRVKAKIIEKKLTQNKLCKLLGIGVSSLSRWLNGLTAKMNPAYKLRMDEM